MPASRPPAPLRAAFVPLPAAPRAPLPRRRAAARTTCAPVPRRFRPAARAAASASSTPGGAVPASDPPPPQGPPSDRERDVLDALRPADYELDLPLPPAPRATRPAPAAPPVPPAPAPTAAAPRPFERVSLERDLRQQEQDEEDDNDFYDEFDGEAIVAAWAQKGYASALSRTLEIWTFFFRMVTGEMRNRKIKDPAALAAARRKQAIALKEGLLSLGPTFIKIGQLLSTRVDIVPKEYIEELSVLQDRVPGFSGMRAIEVIEAEFGRPIAEIFDTFETRPIAAASLGQVHRATLNGEQVAVKIQRAGLKELFDVDLKNLKVLAKMLDKFDPKTDGARRNWVQIYDESAKLLYEEIDYVMEGRNADRFRNNFASTDWVKVPGIYWDLTSTRVLTMEYVPGIKINDYDSIEKAGLDRKIIAQRSAESYLTQLLRHGYFHTDPHCGNLAVDTVAGGRLIYYDFGMMSTFEPHIKKGLVDVIFGIYEGSAKDICDAMVGMGVLSGSADRITVEKVGRYFLGLFRVNLDNKNRRKNKEEKRAEMIKRLDSIGEDLLAVSEDECFNFPPVFTFVFRAFTTLEGIGKGLNPNYDLTIIAGPYLKELIDLRDGSAALTAVKSFRKRVGWRNEDIRALVTQPRKTAYIEDTLRRMESGDLRLRVRVLESERAFKRVTLMQNNMALAMAAATLSNMALVLTTAAERFAIQARILWLLAAIVAMRLVVGLVKYRSLEARMRKFVKSDN